jgi:peroxiredoxin
MTAWSEDQNIPMLTDDKAGLTHLYADPYGEVTERLNMEMTAMGPKMKGLVDRCKRFALYIVEGVVEIKRIAEFDDDPAGDSRPDSTLADAMIEAIEEFNKKQQKNVEL